MNPVQTVRLPVFGESAFHYCEDIATSHGWESPNALLKACGQKRLKDWFSDYRRVDTAIDVHIEPFANKSAITIQNFEFFQDSVEQLRICPDCIKENKPHLSMHQIPYITHCTVHGTELVDHCHVCDAQVSSSIRNECPNCLTPFTSGGDSAPQYMRCANNQSNPLQLLQKLSSTAELILRPWDLLQETTEWKKLRNKDIVLALECAFNFVSDDLALTQYKDYLHIHHLKNCILLEPVLSEKVNILTAAVTECRELCESRLALTLAGIDKARLDRLSSLSEKILPQKRLKVVSNDQGELAQQCSGRQINRAFGLDCVTLNELIEMNICIPISNTRVLNHALFCFKSTVERINARLPQYHFGMRGDHVCFSYLSDEVLKAYALTKGEIFLAILKGEIEARFDHKHRLEGSRIFIEKSSLLAYISDRPVFNDHLSIEVLANVLAYPVEAIGQLITMRTGLLYAKYVKTGPNLLDYVTVNEFMRDYISLNRLAWLHKCTPREISNRLKIRGYVTQNIYMYSGCKTTRVSFVRKDNCDPEALSNVLNTFPKRLIQKRWYVRDPESIFDGIEECYDHLDMAEAL
ncbi:MAG: TniQ family protein [Gammaproteobacteria bacterium]|nr:TniQ family protein [Gammaproteobacteria bacterium]MBU1554245.1 TniQ family protein [Gammaproteobacteria bacterium]MBU2072706.1 TniQ family protein [Gammaproteobacteria bacterium]MBU2182160.1 TniQ family protein [Gammaproteobacteria bacterium]MBU2204774.1 TniQ family protein [Gammaproteobacteria bacterium]